MTTPPSSPGVRCCRRPHLHRPLLRADPPPHPGASGGWEARCPTEEACCVDRAGYPARGQHGGAVSTSAAGRPWGEATKTLGCDLSPGLPGWEGTAALPSGEDVPSTWPRLGGVPGALDSAWVVSGRVAPQGTVPRPPVGDGAEFPQFFLEATEAISGVDVGRLEVEDRDLPGSPNWVARFTILEGDPDGQFAIRTDPRTNEGVLSVVKVSRGGCLSSHPGAPCGPSVHPQEGSQGDQER